MMIPVAEPPGDENVKYEEMTEFSRRSITCATGTLCQLHTVLHYLYQMYHQCITSCVPVWRTMVHFVHYDGIYTLR